MVDAEDKWEYPKCENNARKSAIDFHCKKKKNTEYDQNNIRSLSISRNTLNTTSTYDPCEVFVNILNNLLMEFNHTICKQSNVTINIKCC
jgi:hypothetical protein